MMKKVILYIAISLDGKIAKPDGDVSWLGEVENPEGTDHGYGEFYQTIDTIIMGHSTYKKVLGFGGDFPYPDKTCYVVTTHSELEGDEHVSFVSGNIEAFIRKIKKDKGKDIWLVGGGQLNAYLWNCDLIDEIQLFVMPVVIGEGIPLFGGITAERQLSLLFSKPWPTGAVQMVYGRRR